MSEWLAVEAIVRQRDKETQANAIAKLSSESVSGEQAPTQIQRELSNDVRTSSVYKTKDMTRILFYRFSKT